MLTFSEHWNNEIGSDCSESHKFWVGTIKHEAKGGRVGRNDGSWSGSSRSFGVYSVASLEGVSLRFLDRESTAFSTSPYPTVKLSSSRWSLFISLECIVRNSPAAGSNRCDFVRCAESSVVFLVTNTASLSGYIVVKGYSGRICCAFPVGVWLGKDKSIAF